MRHSVLAKKASLVGAFFVSAIWLAPAQALCKAPPGLEPVPVERVVDGDTVRLGDGRSVRLIGLNAPELAGRGRSEEPYAVKAKRRLQALIQASDQRVMVRLGAQSKDRYGRTLAHLYDIRGANLEARLLAEGLGYFVAVAPNTALVDCHRQAESQARQQRLGVWSKGVPRPAHGPQTPGFSLLRGRVSALQDNRGGLWLTLADDVVLQVSPALRQHFDLAALKALRGREIEVRGWLVDRRARGSLKPGYARWMLPLTDPAMIESLP